ncbi:AarF/UbiB family protein [Bdellovibrio sp. HCB337]|uniref:AarF/UbiB family protein n=1 Tax=Bdellovibrio sp. HCB337 TaxID=3394358 RepID=UPI0039A74476
MNVVSLNGADRLRRLRQLLGYSQRDLAKELQVTNGAIAHWESGTRPIPGPIVKLLDLYEKSLLVNSESQPSVDQEALKHSNALLQVATKILKIEGLALDDNKKHRLGKLLDSYVTKTYSNCQIRGKLKVILAGQLLKSLAGSRGLSLKAAQIIATLEPGLPTELPAILGDLQFSKNPMSFTQIQKILSAAYTTPVNKIFKKICPQPLAVTSLAQLYRANLETGEEVVLKIQHHQIREYLEQRSGTKSFLNCLASILGKDSPTKCAVIYTQVLHEIDYEREVRHQELYRNIFAHEPRIVVPKIHRELCRKNIIVSAYEPGISFSEFCARGNSQEKSQAGLTIAFFHAFALLRHGLQHGDAHPCNLLFRGDQVVFFDFGRIFEISADDLASEATIYSSILHKNKQRVFEEYKKRDIIVSPESFDFEEYWHLLLRNQEHHLANTFKFTTSHMRALDTEIQSFKDRHKIKLSSNFLRAGLINPNLLSLFAELEVKGPWRTQLLSILDAQIDSPKVLAA